ncbi:UNVERIFIED_CONTAM: GNAT family N-acetyltransferase, partial [Bacteroidetes bacterium 56_B9]
HRFLRHQWYAAALRTYGGAARTLTVSAEDVPVLALPMIAIGPALLRVATVPGSYWPFRSFPVAADAGVEVLEEALDALAQEVNALRIGPAGD